eukprot:2715925-Rhodomonas_salina.1
MVLRLCYAVPGTDSTTLSATVLAYHTVLRRWYSMCGTDEAYGGTGRQDQVGASGPLALACQRPPRVRSPRF